MFGAIIHFVMRSKDRVEASVGPFSAKGVIEFVIMFTGIIIFVNGTID